MFSVGENNILKYLNNMKNDSEVSIIKKKTKEVYDVFTDGSEIKQKGTFKTLGLGWAYIIKKNKETVHYRSGTMKEGNNQRVELMAIYKALEYLLNDNDSGDDVRDIIIHSDSEYSIKSLTVWSLNWRRNNWLTANKKPVKHTDIIKPCIKMMEELKKKGDDYVFNHVRSHTNKRDFIHLGNQEADDLATQASKSSMKK